MKTSFLYFTFVFVIPLTVCCQTPHPGTSSSNPPGNAVQYIHSGNLVYMDTTWRESIRPDSILVYFYNLGGKYPESSQTIKEKAGKYLQKTNHIYSGSGYITFRFFIDSTGNMLKRIQLIQTDEFYKDYTFNETLVSDLFHFLKTLQSWKPAHLKTGIPPYYVNFISFKIHEGNLVNIIP
jgi:hypothetical protein